MKYGVWEFGYGPKGITGPTVPAVHGPTVGEQCARREWLACGGADAPPRLEHYIVSRPNSDYRFCGANEVVAIVPGEHGDGESIASLIAAAPDLLHDCQALIAYARTKYGVPAGEPLSCPHMRAIEADIAKATGEQATRQGPQDAPRGDANTNQ